MTDSEVIGKHKDTNLTKLVYALKDLPFLPPILLESEAERQVFFSARHQYKSASFWLRHILLGEALQPVAYKSLALAMKPFAEFLAALFRLAIAVYSRTTDPKFLYFGSPAELWFYCVVKLSHNQLQDQGLTGKPLLLGKRGAWDLAVKYCSRLRSLEYQPERIRLFEKDLYTLLVIEAQALAKIDKNFYKEHFLPFVQAIRRTAKKNKESDQVQFYRLLPNDTLFVTGNKKKLSVLLKSAANYRKVPKLV